MPGFVIDLGRYVGSLVMNALVAAVAGLAMLPAWWLYTRIDAQLGAMWAVFSCPLLYIVWGWSYCLGCVLWKNLVWYHPKEGEWNLFSLHAIGWATTSGMTNVANDFFLRFWRGTPYLNLYLRMMGAKIGHRVSINTAQIFDWNLLTIDDDVILGGDCVVQAHVVEGGKMKMRPVHIQQGALVGSGSKVLPGCTIGRRAVLGAESMMKKGESIPDDEIWGGIPAKFLKKRGEKPGG